MIRCGIFIEVAMKQSLHLLLCVMSGLISLGTFGHPDQTRLTKLDVHIAETLCSQIKKNKFDEGIATLSRRGVYYARLLNHGRCDGLPFLHKALSVYIMNNSLIWKMLQQGADIHQALEENYGNRFFKGYTPVHIAARREFFNGIYGTLKHFNGDFFRPDEDGWRPIDIAFFDGNKPAIKWLAKKYDLNEMEIRREKPIHFYRKLVHDALPLFVMEIVEPEEKHLKLVKRAGEIH